MSESSEYTATIAWSRENADFLDNRFSRAHVWTFDGGATVPASPSPHIHPAPMSDATCVDPEEAFVASVSSCHMLFFLSIAAKRRFVVDTYVDEPVGVMEKNGDGRVAMTRMALRPAVTFSGDNRPTEADIDRMHERAHDLCFIANSVKTDVVVEPTRAGPA